MEERISIIVPVYNTQRYIKKCLNSILNQSYNNVEIVVINDGSTKYLFNYLKRRGSITHSLNLHVFDYIDNVIERYEYIYPRHNNIELEKLCRKQIFYTLMTLTSELNPSVLMENNPAKNKYDEIHRMVYTKYSYKDCGLDETSYKLLEALKDDVQSYMISSSIPGSWYKI